MAQRTLQKRAGRTVRASEDGRYQGNKGSPAQQDWLMHRHPEMWQHSMQEACTSLSQRESKSCEGKQTQAPILAPKAISSWWAVSPKGEIILWWRPTGDANHTNGQAPGPAIEGQHKTTPIAVLEIFECVWASIVFPLHIFYLYGIVFCGLSVCGQRCYRICMCFLPLCFVLFWFVLNLFHFSLLQF